MRWSENSKVSNPRWNLESPIHYQIFGPLTSTCGCPFLVQGQPLQVVLFGHFTHELALSYPTYSMHIPSYSLYSNHWRRLIILTH
jgi:hypothetical protein